MSHFRFLQDGLPGATGTAVRRIACRYAIRRNAHGLLWTFLLLFFAVVPVVAADSNPFLREDFDSLAQWEPLTFPKIKAHSTYTLIKEDGQSILKAESRDSASALVNRRNFNVYETPRLRWRWKVEQLSDRGDPKEKAGDDYPVRVFVMFFYDPTRATLGERLLAPTRIYVRSVLPLTRALRVHALAHITGGGITENLPRVLPQGTQARVDLGSFRRPAVFDWLKTQGGIAESEMRRTFNCGLGMVVCVAREDVDTALTMLRSAGEEAWVLGEIESAPGAPRVVYTDTPDHD